ncbi:hypothetical protein [Nocardia sp. CNY236]|uniref:hypothetical protein n=1 Tax=Nocardia sp. CNY236 TaxID=1169152 RepID=UPI0012DF3BF5|nr:hypothetical protein [Nocardia sp. CNY236]
MIPTAVDGFLMAQVYDPVPEAPPSSEKILQLVRYFSWFAILSGVTGIAYAGGKFAWEKWQGGPLASAKMVAGGMLGGLIATSAGAIMNALVG